MQTDHNKQDTLATRKSGDLPKGHAPHDAPPTLYVGFVQVVDETVTRNLFHGPFDSVAKANSWAIENLSCSYHIFQSLVFIQNRAH